MKISSGKLFLLLVGMILIFIGVSYIRVITCDEKCIKFVSYEMFGALQKSLFVAKKNNVSSVEMVDKVAVFTFGGRIYYDSWVQFYNGRKESLLCANSKKRVSRICKELENSLSSEQSFKLRTWPLKIISVAGLVIIFLTLFARLNPRKNKR